MKKSIAKTKRNIRQEVQRKAMQERIIARAEQITDRFLDEIQDEVGDLMGRIETDMLDDGSGIEAEIVGYAHDQVERLLLAEVKRQLK